MYGSQRIPCNWFFPEIFFSFLREDLPLTNAALIDSFDCDTDDFSTQIFHWQQKPIFRWAIYSESEIRQITV